ncbi:MAG: hypothetical protein IT314_02285 [Anaerolineales bacterium]|nr:hypothetical protein [Anaerolineales bacterium]
MAGTITFALYPNLNGIGGIMLSLMCAIPFAFISFVKLRSDGKSNWYKVYLFPALIFPFLIILFFGWTAFQQRPSNIFKVFLADPIPEGVSNIRAKDVSVGIDQEIVIAFDSTEKAIEEIVATNKLKLDNDQSNSDRNDLALLLDFFEVKDQDQEWLFYTRYDNENRNWWFLWVNVEKTKAYFRYIDG